MPKQREIIRFVSGDGVEVTSEFKDTESNKEELRISTIDIDKELLK